MIFKVILIGPISAGKSTLSKLIAEKLGIPCRHMDQVLILPSLDKEKSVKILNDRTGGVVSEGFDFHEHFVTHHSNYDLVKHIVYTEGKTPEETCAEIVEIITSRRQAPLINEED